MTEKLLIVVGDDRAREQETFLQELDMIADTIQGLGLDVIRFDHWWPRNRFTSLPNFTLHNRERSRYERRDIIADNGLFLDLGSTLLFSDYIKETIWMKDLERTVREMLDKKVEFFATTPKNWFNFPKYPGNIVKGKPLVDIDYTANRIESLDAIVTYSTFYEMNREVLRNLRGYDNLILLPEEEFNSMAVNFETFWVGDEEIVVMNPGTPKSVEIIKSYGMEVEILPRSLKHINWIYDRATGYRKWDAGGSVRCATNKFYLSSLENTPGELKKIFIGLENYA